MIFFVRLYNTMPALHSVLLFSNIFYHFGFEFFSSSDPAHLRDSTQIYTVQALCGILRGQFLTTILSEWRKTFCFKRIAIWVWRKLLSWHKKNCRSRKMNCRKLTKRRKEEKNVNMVFPFMPSFPSFPLCPSPFLPFGLPRVWTAFLMNFTGNFKVVLISCLTHNNLPTEKTAKPTGNRRAFGACLYIWSSDLCCCNMSVVNTFI